MRILYFVCVEFTRDTNQKFMHQYSLYIEFIHLYKTVTLRVIPNGSTNQCTDQLACLKRVQMSN